MGNTLRHLGQDYSDGGDDVGGGGGGDGGGGQRVVINKWEHSQSLTESWDRCRCQLNILLVIKVNIAHDK